MQVGRLDVQKPLKPKPKGSGRILGRILEMMKMTLKVIAAMVMA